MPELPDVTVYVERLAALTIGQPIEAIRIPSPFVLRTVTPSPKELVGAKVLGVERLGKRIVIAVEAERFLVIHLMIAGRLHWKPAGAKVPGKVGLAAFDFSTGTLTLTEAGTKKRAAIHIVKSEPSLTDLDAGGIDPPLGRACTHGADGASDIV